MARGRQDNISAGKPTGTAVRREEVVLMGAGKTAYSINRKNMVPACR